MTDNLPDYAALGQTGEEAALLREHDKNETLHAFVEHACDEECGDPSHARDDTIRCGECGDTAEGLMHSNTWRNVEPLMEGDDNDTRLFLGDMPGRPSMDAGDNDTGLFLGDEEA